ncbi:MAG TPA: mannonate dehydratase [Candidatus Sulfotelmatobacter sp.]
MKETWRWFGPADPIPLAHVKQAGATGIVTALHHLYPGEAWSLDEVFKRKDELLAAGFEWSVVESIPVPNEIKLQSGRYRQLIGAWKDSLVAVAKAGVQTICYNFMPLVDWTRTDARWFLPTTGYALRFDVVDFAAYELFILGRKGAEADYSDQQIQAAHTRFASMTEARRGDLEKIILAGLPGGGVRYDRETFQSSIAEYQGMTAEQLRSSLIEFLVEIVPVAQELGVRLAIHPDDPPRALFGVPRIVSTAEDVRKLFAACDSTANGLTFCVGSFGAREDNDLLSMVREFGARIHFLHLRQVTREPDGSFYEAEHLAGSSDMVGLIHAMLKEEANRRAAGRLDHNIPMRPDHGHLLADDIGKKSNPGYSLVGRLKGLAELRGVIQGLKFAVPELRG